MRNQKKHRRIIRIVALVIGSLLALLLSLLLVPKIVEVTLGTAPELRPGVEWEGQLMIGMYITFMAGYLVGWWRSLWGGIIIITSSLLIVVPLVSVGNIGSFIFGIPLFAIGTLYVLGDRVGSRKSVANED